MGTFNRTALAFACALGTFACAKSSPGDNGYDADAGCYVFDAGTLDPALVAQGQVLVTQNQCQQCHGSQLDGNNDGVTLHGTNIMQFPPNLTSDPATGLGCWTNAQIENAILNSVDNQGQAICGPMPHFSAIGLTQANAESIVAYLRSLPITSNDVASGPSCGCSTDSDCPPGQSCISEDGDAGMACSCLSFACALGDGGTEPEDGGVDAGTPDAGTPDAGVSDAGVSDAGVSDAGVSDAGVSDAGVSDAGVSDAGVSDAGVSDAGVSDAGTEDAGTEDAGIIVDAGAADAGVDAGTDAG